MSEIMDHLDNLSGSYHDENPYYPEVRIRSRAIVDNLIDRVKNMHVLDLGLGHGLIMETLPENAASYVIVEGSKALIEAHRNASTPARHNVRIIHDSFEDFYCDEKFDFILMNSILMYLDDPIKVLRKYIEYLKDDGVLVVSVPNAKSLHRRIGYEAGLLKNISALSKIHADRGHKYYYTPEMIVSQIEAAGYRIVKMQGIFLKIITTEQMKTLGFSEEIYNALVTIGEKYPELCNHIYIEGKKA